MYIPRNISASRKNLVALSRAVSCDSSQVGGRWMRKPEGGAASGVPVGKTVATEDCAGFEAEGVRSMVEVLNRACWLAAGRRAMAATFVRINCLNILRTWRGYPDAKITNEEICELMKGGLAMRVLEEQIGDAWKTEMGEVEKVVGQALL